MIHVYCLLARTEDCANKASNYECEERMRAPFTAPRLGALFGKRLGEDYVPIRNLVEFVLSQGPSAALFRAVTRRLIDTEHQTDDGRSNKRRRGPRQTHACR